MKEIRLKAWQLNKEEAKQKTENDQILIYNPITKRLKVEDGGKKCIANSKYAYSGLIYLSLTEKEQDLWHTTLK